MKDFLLSSLFSQPMFAWSFPIDPTSLPVLAATEGEAEVQEPILVAGVLLSLVGIYFASKIGGEICSRINLPPVLGELVGGVIIGTSALKLLVFPEAGFDSSASTIMNLLQTSFGMSAASTEATFEVQSEVISVLSEFGVIILLFEIGLESDLKDLLKYGPQAALVAILGVVVPFAAGTAGLLIIFDIGTIPAVFAGAALTATSIGITAKVLAEIGSLNAKEGQIIIGAAVLDDVLGIIVLAVVSSLVKTGEIEVANVVYLILGAATFLVGVILVGRFLGSYFVSLVKELKTRGPLLISALVVAFLLAYLAAAIQLEAILGAFAAGLVLGETEIQEDLEEQIAPVADFFVPIFFVVVGAKTNLAVLNPAVPSNREGLIIAAFLIVVAILGKIVSGFAIFNQPGINRLAVGVGMIPRGEVGLVFAGIGAASGALSESLEAGIIVMVIVTTFITPPFLRFLLKTEPATEAVESQSESQ
jgi:Kef-type K+ transport system membrane component KefB